MARYNSCEEYVLQELESKTKECEALKKNYKELEEQLNFVDGKLTEVLDLVKDFMAKVRVEKEETSMLANKGTIYIHGNFVGFAYEDENDFDSLLKLKELVDAIPTRED